MFFRTVLLRFRYWLIRKRNLTPSGEWQVTPLLVWQLLKLTQPFIIDQYAPLSAKKIRVKSFYPDLNKLLQALVAYNEVIKNKHDLPFELSQDVAREYTFDHWAVGDSGIERSLLYWHTEFLDHSKELVNRLEDCRLCDNDTYVYYIRRLAPLFNDLLTVGEAYVFLTGKL